jgi:hypothetical protein
VKHIKLLQQISKRVKQIIKMTPSAAGKDQPFNGPNLKN